MLYRGVRQPATNVVPVADLVTSRESEVSRLLLQRVSRSVPVNYLNPLETVNWCRRKKPHVVLKARSVTKNPLG